MELGIDFWRFEILIFWNLNSPMSLAGWTLLKKNPVFYALHIYILLKTFRTSQLFYKLSFDLTILYLF